MGSIEQAELALVVLAGCEGNTSPASAPYTVSELLDALAVPADRLSQQMTLATTLHELREEGLIEATDDGESLAFSPTEEGIERATNVYEELADTRIELASGTRRALSLEAAAATYDQTIPELVQNLTDDGRYYPEESVEKRLVGRDHERERCREVLERLSETGRGQALFVSGPGGIGKTTLLEDVATTVRTEWAVVRAQCRGTESAPYLPIYELLDQLNADLSTIHSSGPIGDPETFKNRQDSLFYEFTRALSPEADEPPRLCILDDLHLGDPGTIAYLAQLTAVLSEFRIVLAASYRPVEFSLDTFEGLDPEDDDTTVVRLGPIGPTDTRALIEQTTGHRGAPDSLVDVLHDRTGGNPLFVEETVGLLVETNQLDPTFEWYPDDNREVDVPTAVRESIARQLDALEAPARDVLRWAALIGDRVPVSVLERVVDRPAVQVETLVDVLLEATIFEWTRDRGVLTFQSEVVREALRPETPDRSRHDAIARAFEAEYAASGVDSEPSPTDWAPSIADHHERAGNAGEALEWYRWAGEQAMEVYANEAAEKHYVRALSLATNRSDTEAILTLTERLATVYLVSAAFDRAERHVEYARERASDPSHRQRLAALRTRLANVRGDCEAALDAAAEGLAIGRSSSRPYCELLLGRAEANAHLGEFDEAIETTETAQRLATELEDPDLVVRATKLLGTIATKRDRFDAARTHLEEALAVAEDVGDRFGSGSIHLSMGSVAFKQDDRDAMREHNVRALEHFEAAGDVHGAALARSNLAVLDRKRGDIDRARMRLERTIETFTGLGDHHSVARQRGNLGSIALSQGQYEAARESYEQALTTFEAVGERREIAIARTGLGETALKQRRYESARVHFERARDAFEAMEIRRGGANATLGLGIVSIERGECDAAREQIEAVLDVYETIGDRSRSIVARLALAQLDTVTSSPGRGLERWDAIAEEFEMIDPSHSVDPFERLVRACRSEGDVETAAEWCRRGLDRIADLDVAGLERLRAFLLDELAALETERESTERESTERESTERVGETSDRPSR